MAEPTPLTFSAPRGDLRVAASGDCVSHWQPLPANGYAETILCPDNINTVHRFSMGRQLLPPGGRVRLHSHEQAEEVLYVLAGSGTAEIEAATHRMLPGTTLYLGHNRVHTFLNDGTEDLQWLWFFMPGGLETFFAAIGPERKVGDPTPPPFARPANIAEIEARTVIKT